MAAKEVWRAANLLTKSWEDGVIVYNLDSGSTHLLNPIAGQVLSFLVAAPANATNLSRRLAAQIDLESDAELDQNVKDLLDQLDSLGLVQAITE
jgi:PqqD family protein of HPr-rel-A system